MINPRIGYTLLIGSYLFLFGLLIMWHGWLSPSVRIPTSVVLVFSVGPLLLVLRGILAMRAKAIVWTIFLSLGYFVHGISGIMVSETDLILACLEVAAAIGIYTGALLHLKTSRQHNQPASDTTSSEDV